MSTLRARVIAEGALKINSSALKITYVPLVVLAAFGQDNESAGEIKEPPSGDQ